MLGDRTGERGERMRLRLSILVLFCCVGALPGGPSWGQCEQQNIFPADGHSGDHFGTWVAVDAGRMVIGAPGVDDPESSAGAAYVYFLDGWKWGLQTVLHAEDGQMGDDFGWSVDIDGDVIVVGAPWCDDNGFNAGAAYVFRFDGSDWVQEQKLLASDGASSDRFGCAVAVSGETIIVGAAWDGDDTGSVYIYRFDGSAWVETHKKQVGNPQAQYGYAVAMSGDIVVVGAPGFDGHGAAWCLRDTGDYWAIINITPFGLDDNDDFGFSVATTGDVVVVGATGDDDEGASTGAAYVYRRDGNDWVGEQKLVASTGHPYDSFGSAVAVDGDRIVVGAQQNDEPGRAYVYHFDGLTWDEQAELQSPFCSPGGRLGCSVAILGDMPIAGAKNDSASADSMGGVHVFDITGDDCNANGLCDWVDLLHAYSEDCNSNEIPDECDIAFPVEEHDGMMPIGWGYPQHLTIEDPLDAIGDVELDLLALGDLDADDEWIDVDINGTYIGRVFASDGSECANPMDHSVLAVPAETFNALIDGPGEAVITMTASEPVDPFQCGGISVIILTVSYDGRINDANANGIPDECECPADFDGDGDVDTADLLFLLGAWGTPIGDVDGDGDTDTADLLALLAAWGDCPG